VLAVHGWMDNAGTFDKLFPLLPRSLYIMAIEMPGHGRSSHFPAGMPYHYIVSRIHQKHTELQLQCQKINSPYTGFCHSDSPGRESFEMGEIRLHWAFDGRKPRDSICLRLSFLCKLTIPMIPKRSTIYVLDPFA
jgi:pimeloyl-ACP methyl ester carboxylesterase